MTAEELEAEISRLRHDLANARAATQMAVELFNEIKDSCPACKAREQGEDHAPI